MIKNIIILHYNAITPSATALLGTCLYFSPICWLSGRTMTGLLSKGSHKPNWQISIGTHRHRAKVGFGVEWHLDIWSACPLFCYWLSVCKRDIWSRHMSPYTPGLWAFCLTLPAPPWPCGTKSCKKLILNPVTASIYFLLYQIEIASQPHIYHSKQQLVIKEMCTYVHLSNCIMQTLHWE